MEIPSHFPYHKVPFSKILWSQNKDVFQALGVYISTGAATVAAARLQFQEWDLPQGTAKRMMTEDNNNKRQDMFFKLPIVLFSPFPILWPKRESLSWSFFSLHIAHSFRLLAALSLSQERLGRG